MIGINARFRIFSQSRRLGGHGRIGVMGLSPSGPHIANQLLHQ